MELIFRDGRYMGIARYTMKERIAMHVDPRNLVQPAHKTFIAVSNGTVIIPDNDSYTQFINNTWYE